MAWQRLAPTRRADEDLTRAPPHLPTRARAFRSRRTSTSSSSRSSRACSSRRCGRRRVRSRGHAWHPRYAQRQAQVAATGQFTHPSPCGRHAALQVCDGSAGTQEPRRKRATAQTMRWIPFFFCFPRFAKRRHRRDRGSPSEPLHTPSRSPLTAPRPGELRGSACCNSHPTPRPCYATPVTPL